MKKLLKVTGIIVGVIVIALGAGIIYLKTAFPKVGEATDIQIERTEERLKRGEYLVTKVMACLHCHSEMNHQRFGKPSKPGTQGAGGERFDLEAGFPGIFYAKNITPATLGNWTDGEIVRAITSGVSKDGSPLFNLMPYKHYGQLAREDIYSIVAYLRTLEPVENNVPESEPAFPVSLLINTFPQEPAHGEIPDKSDEVAYGKYLVTAAACNDCHTPMKNGQYVKEMYMAGGFDFPMKTGGVTRSANITPHDQTGIGTWSKFDFVQRFKQYAVTGYTPEFINEGEFNTEMPWSVYAKMDTTDLEAIFAYLQSIDPIENKVEKFTYNP